MSSRSRPRADQLSIPRTARFLVLPRALSKAGVKALFSEVLEETEAKRVAAELDIPILDTSEVLSGIADKCADGLHLNERSLEMLAQFLSSHIHITKSKELSNAP